MKKFITILIILIISTTPAFSKSIFQKQEEIQTDRTAPFFINIYAESDDINSDFEELRLNYTPQVEILSKGFDIPVPKEENNLFVTAKKSAGVDLFKLQIESVEFMTNYKYGKWDLSGGMTQEAISGINQYYNYISFEPTYRLNDSFSIFGGISHVITANYDQTSIGIKYTPARFKRLSFKLGLVNYTKQFYNYRNRFSFETNFKI